MNIAKSWNQWTHTLLKPMAVAESEIRDELEFHLEMRTQDNERLGMEPEAARRDARERFGDFERSFAACREVSLGWRRALRWTPWALLTLLAAAVVYLSTTLVSSQARYEEQLRVLRHQVAQAQRGQETFEDRMRVRHWSWPQPIVADRPQVSGAVNFAAAHLDHPWCDWDALDVPRP